MRRTRNALLVGAAVLVAVPGAIYLCKRLLAERGRGWEIGHAASVAQIIHNHLRAYPSVDEKRAAFQSLDLSTLDLTTLDPAGGAATKPMDDHWGRPLVITLTDKGDLIVRSLGPDGVANTEDDVVR